MTKILIQAEWLIAYAGVRSGQLLGTARLRGRWFEQLRGRNSQAVDAREVTHSVGSGSERGICSVVTAERSLPAEFYATEGSRHVQQY